MLLGFSGTIIEWPHERVELGDWSPVKFFSRLSWQLDAWRWFMEDKRTICAARRNSQVSAQQDRGIRGAFTRSDTIRHRRHDRLCGSTTRSDKPNAAATKICMEQTPDSYIHAKPQICQTKDTQTRGGGSQTLPSYMQMNYGNQRGRLMIPDKISCQLQCQQ